MLEFEKTLLTTGCVSIWGRSINAFCFRPAGFAAVARGFLASGVLLRRARCPHFETPPLFGTYLIKFWMQAIILDIPFPTQV
jgi:hypothetical protein